MCGIVGYIGDRSAVPLLIEGLKRLEYRGYDSAGLTVINGSGLETRKAVGKIAELEKLVGNGDGPVATMGIAHTRWATHGAPNEINAHPHLSCNGEIALVHNGIIENAGTLRKKLEALGHQFRSETDTEVIVHLIEEAYDNNLESAVQEALRQVEGAYGLAIVSSREPRKIVAARKGSPLLLGVTDNGEYFVASDVAAVLAHTRHVVYLEDGEMAVLSEDGYRTMSLGGESLTKEVKQISWDLDAIEKGGHEHFMLKEIFEQPTTILQAIRGRVLEADGTVKFGGLNLEDDQLAAFNRIVISACGTSWHSALIGEYMLEELCRIPVDVEYASEFRYRNPIVDERTLMLVISQSGETADTLAAAREARELGATVLGIVNVVGSTIAREAQGGIYLHAGPEIGVASTKAFTSQVVALTLFTVRMARLRGVMSAERGREILHALTELPDKVEQVLELNDAIRELAPHLQECIQLPVPRPRLQLPDRARGRAQAERDQLHPRGGTACRRDEARADRTHRRKHAGGGDRAARLGVQQSALEHPGSESARRSCHRRCDAGQYGAGRDGRSHDPDPGHDRDADADTHHHSAATAGLPHRGHARLQRGHAA